MSLFSNVEGAPPIEVFKLTRDFQADTDPQKVSLGVGAYRTEEGKPWILPVVKKAEQKLAEETTFLVVLVRGVPTTASITGRLCKMMNISHKNIYFFSKLLL